MMCVLCAVWWVLCVVCVCWIKLNKNRGLQ